MLNMSSSSLKINSDVVFNFPSTLCCNCGTVSHLAIVDQDTRVTRYMFGGGTELTFSFPLPFCKQCTKTAKRRPKGFFNYILIFILTLAVTASALVGIGFTTENTIISEYLFIIAFVIGSMLMLAWIALTRPKGNQTSYFQPVRIHKLRQEFIRGIIKAIDFKFTNQQYAREFTVLNQPSITNKTINVC